MVFAPGLNAVFTMLLFQVLSLDSNIPLPEFHSIALFDSLSSCYGTRYGSFTIIFRVLPRTFIFR